MAKAKQASPRDQIEVVAQETETKAKKPPQPKMSKGKPASRSAAAAQRETIQQPKRANG